MTTVADALTDAITLEIAKKHIAELQDNQAKGIAELRRYVEGNGFQWQDGETAVWNVTTAIGLMGGQIEAQKEQLAAVTAERDEMKLRIRAADAMAKAVDEAIRLGRLNSRSAIADARLDYGEPFPA